MKFLEKQKLAVRISILTSAITVVGLFLLWGIVSFSASAIVRKNIINQMSDTVKSHAAIINDYVSYAEKYMTAFALSDEVRELLRDPENPALLERAQEYTEDFAAVRGSFEGLYIATPETYVLTHTSQEAIGITTRKGDDLKSFQQTILDEPRLTNLGIMKSPGTGAMILSMYYPIFENEECIGYVGAGVFASTLMDSLLELKLQGLPDSEYVFVNAETGVYLYHEDEKLLNTETTDPGYLDIIQQSKFGISAQPEIYTYRDENGEKQLVVYQYLRDRDWIFMVRNNTSEVFASISSIQIQMGVMCIAVMLLIIFCLVSMMRRVSENLERVEAAIGCLGRFELNADKELASLYKRGDEIGVIARTTHAMCDHLRQTIDDIRRILGEMASGNILVNVEQSEVYYIGDFQVLAQSLKMIRSNLLQLTRSIAQVSNNVTKGAECVSQSAESLSSGAATQADSVTRLTKSANSITKQIRLSADNCSAVQELVDQAVCYSTEADEKMNQLTEAMSNVTHSSKEIEKIIRVMKDIAFKTNRLALNASIEAAQTGAAGKGFAIIANEVRNLAAKSEEAVKTTVELINRSIQDVHSGINATAQVGDIVHTIDKCVGSIKGKVHEIAAASAHQSSMISDVSERVEEISQVVQTNSSVVGQSVDTSQELFGQAKELHDLISQFRIND